MAIKIGLGRKVEEKSNYEMTKEERFRELHYRNMLYDTELIGCYIVTTEQNRKQDKLEIKAQIATGNGPKDLVITKENLDRFETMDRAMDNIDPHMFAAFTALNMDVQAMKNIVISVALHTKMMTSKELQQMLGSQD